MPHKGKRYKADLANAPADPLPLADAVQRIKSFKAAKFDQTVELCVHLGIDAKQADQAVRGSISLPHGIGKSKRVIAFCPDDKIPADTEAGAIKAGGEELVKEIEGGWMDFDVAVADPSMMRVVARLGKTLGPKGLMPSPKAGTVTPQVAQAVKEYSAGKVEYRNDAGGNVHCVIGKHSFAPQQLQENAQSFIDHLLKIKPSAAKGQYIKKVSMSATMTPGVLVAV